MAQPYQGWETPSVREHLVTQYFQLLWANTGHTEKIINSCEPAVTGSICDNSRGQGRPDSRDLLQILDLCPINVDATGSQTQGGRLGR